MSKAATFASDVLTDDLIESRVAVHDSNHVEIKLDYVVPTREQTTYRVDGYFFVPRNLGVSKQSYSAEQFYADIQGYVRFKTPRIRLRNLVDPERPDSALGLIHQALRNLIESPGDPLRQRRLEYQLKMFGCVARANVRDRALAIHSKLARLRATPRFEPQRAFAHGEITRSLLSDVELAFPRWRELSRALNAGDVPLRIRETYAWIDEYLSLVLEIRLTSVLLELESQELSRYEWDGLPARLVAHLLGERRHRTAAGYGDTVRVASGNELMVFRLGMLKKFVYSVLWLEVSKAREGVKAANLGAAIAAGAAMFVAVIATVYQTRWFGLNSWPFIFAATVTYMLKDRLKDWLKLSFNRASGRWAYDYSVDITDPLQGAKVGHCREAFAYLAPRSVPADVYAVRRATDEVSIEAEARPEVVMRYSKLVRLSAQAMGPSRAHLEAYELNDIIRFSLREFLSRADDSVTHTPLYDEVSGRVVERELRKVYHINLVLAFRAAQDARPTLRRLRIVFDKQSVLRIVEVHPNGLEPRERESLEPEERDRK